MPALRQTDIPSEQIPGRNANGRGVSALRKAAPTNIHPEFAAR
jgi:hypothetical protein